MSQPASAPNSRELWPASSPEHNGGEAADDALLMPQRLPVDPKPPQPSCLLFRLPDHLLLEVGLWLDDLCDLHTLLRRTCKRLSQITEATEAAAAPAAPPCPAPAAAAPQPSSSSDGCSGGKSGSSNATPQARGSGQGHDRTMVAPTPVPATAASAALTDKPWPPSADIQARWLLRWRGAPTDDGNGPPVDCLSRPAWRGDVDVTLAVLDRMAVPGHLSPDYEFGYDIVCPLLIALTEPDAEPQHTAVLEAVMQRHWAAVAALDPEDHASFMRDSAREGGLAIVRAMLRLGAGSKTCDGLMRDELRSCCPPAFSAKIRWGRLPITAGDVALYEAARCRQGGVVEEILSAEREGRASLSPVSVILSLATIVLGEGWTADGDGPMAAALEPLTAMPQLRDRVRLAASSGAMLSEIIMGLFSRVIGAVGTGTNVAMMVRLLSALPRLRLAVRSLPAFEHITAGHSAMLQLLLDPNGPRDAASPVDADEDPHRDAAIMSKSDVEILDDLLVAAAHSGTAEAAAAVLGAVENVAGVGGTMFMVAGGRALRQAAVRGHAGVIGVLLGGGRRGAVPFEVRAAAARSAFQRGHALVAVELLRE